VTEAERELTSTRSEDFNTLATMEEPPDAVAGVFHALCVLLQVKS
jgi:hypothetical protein